MEAIELKTMGSKDILGAKTVTLEIGTLYSVMGSATSRTVKDGQNGVQITLKGRFRATRSSDGQVFESGTCYLPGFPAEMVVNALDCRADKSKAVDFAFEISKVEAEKAILGFEYGLEIIIKPVIEIDPLKALELKLREQALSKKEKNGKDKKA